MAVDVQAQVRPAPYDCQVRPSAANVMIVIDDLANLDRVNSPQRSGRLHVGSAADARPRAGEQLALVRGHGSQSAPTRRSRPGPVGALSKAAQQGPMAVGFVTIGFSLRDHSGVQLAVMHDQIVDLIALGFPWGQT